MIEQGYPGSDSGRPPGGLSLKRIALISALCLVGAALVLGLYPRALVYAKLRPWDQEGPRAVAVAFASAVAARDAEGLRGLLVDPSLVSTDDEGVTMVQIGGGGKARHVPIETLAVGGDPAEVEVQYTLSDLNPRAGIAMPLASGDGTVRLTLAPVDGQWRIVRLLMKGGAMRAVRPGPGAPGSGEAAAPADGAPVGPSSESPPETP